MPMMKHATRIAFALAFVVASVATPGAFAQEADLSVEKLGSDTSPANADVTYTVTITNAGPDDAANVTLGDTPPGTMTFVSATQNNGPVFTCSPAISCSIATFPAGASAEFSFVFHIPVGTAPGTTFTNFATASSQSLDPNDENNVGVASTTVPIPTCDMGILKDGPFAVGADTDLVYTITLSNGGPDPASNVLFTDTLPAPLTFVSLVQSGGSPSMTCGTSTCTAAIFGAGETVTLTLTGHVPAGTAFGTLIQNDATISSDTTDSNDENNAATSAATVSDVDISASKSGPGSVAAGTNASYTITIANGGPDPAANAVLSDPLPPGTTFVSLVQDNGPSASCATPAVGTNGTVSCSFATLAAATSAQFTLVLNSGGAPSISNTATGSTSSFDTNASNDSATAVTSVTQSADLSIVKTGPDPITAGTDATWSVTVSNAGPSAAVNVVVSDLLPAGTTFVSANQTSGPAFPCVTPAVGGTGTITCTGATLAAGASATFSFVLHLDSGITGGTILANAASVASSTPDPTGANDASTASATVTAAPAPAEAIPALSPHMLALLGLALAGIGAFMHRSN